MQNPFLHIILTNYLQTQDCEPNNKVNWVVFRLSQKQKKKAIILMITAGGEILNRINTGC